MRIVRRGCSCLVLLVLAGVCLAAGTIFLPYFGAGSAVVVEFPKGTGSKGMAEALVAARVVRYQWQFLLVRALRPSARLQAGEYRFEDEASPWDVFRRIVRGDVVYYEVTVPEGYNLYEVADAVGRLGLVSREAFLEAARDPALISDIAPRAASLEGYLFPSTYRVTRHMNAAQICRAMTAEFRHVWKELKAPEGADVHALVTLASMVEKETGVAGERPLVASVYSNRLRIGMKLDCDPTTIYAAMLSGRYDGVIHKSDLEREHPYNTYRVAGLPPGPIANPGRASLAAALKPAVSSYLYFVARPDGSGAHVFSADIAAHGRAVAQYRRGRH